MKPVLGGFETWLNSLNSDTVRLIFGTHFHPLNYFLFVVFCRKFIFKILKYIQLLTLFFTDFEYDKNIVNTYRKYFVVVKKYRLHWRHIWCVNSVNCKTMNSVSKHNLLGWGEHIWSLKCGLKSYNVHISGNGNNNKQRKNSIFTLLIV